MGIGRRGAPARALFLAIAGAYGFTQVIGAHAAESNFWQARRRAAGQRDVLLAGLPGALPRAASIFDGGVSPSHPPSKFSGLPAGTAEALLPHGTISLQRAGRSDAPLVLLIQDVHGQAAAQKNIAAMLGALAGRGMAMAAVEGAAGPLDFSAYRRAAGPKARALLADYFLEKGVLAGSQWAGLAAEKAPALHGAEDPALYQAHLDVARRCLAAQPAAQKDLAALAAAVETLEARTYSPALNELSRARRAYDAGQEKLGAYLRRLAALAPPAPGSALAIFLDAWDRESRLDLAAAEEERARFLERLTGVASRPELEDLLRRGVDYREGRADVGEFYARLTALARARGLGLSAYPAFAAYVDYVQAAARVPRAALLDGMEAAETAAARRAAGSEKEMRLWETARAADRLARLFRVEMTPDEWARYAARREGLAPALARLGGDAAAAERLERTRAPFEEFCRLALRRDHTLADAVARLVEKNRLAVTALVAGGFHTPGLSGLLSRRGYRVAVVTPRIELVHGGRPLDVFARDPLPLEKFLAGERISLAPELRLGPALELEFTGVAGALSAHLRESPSSDAKRVGDAVVAALPGGLTVIAGSGAAPARAGRLIEHRLLPRGLFVDLYAPRVSWTAKIRRVLAAVLPSRAPAFLRRLSPGPLFIVPPQPGRRLPSVPPPPSPEYGELMIGGARRLWDRLVELNGGAAPAVVQWRELSVQRWASLPGADTDVVVVEIRQRLGYIGHSVSTMAGRVGDLRSARGAYRGDASPYMFLVTRTFGPDQLDGGLVYVRADLRGQGLYGDIHRALLAVSVAGHAGKSVRAVVHHIATFRNFVRRYGGEFYIDEESIDVDKGPAVQGFLDLGLITAAQAADFYRRPRLTNHDFLYALFSQRKDGLSAAAVVLNAVLARAATPAEADALFKRSVVAAHLAEMRGRVPSAVPPAPASKTPPQSLADPFWRTLRDRGAWGGALYAALTVLAVPIVEELVFRQAVWGGPLESGLEALLAAAGLGAPSALAFALFVPLALMSVPLYVFLHPAAQALHRRFVNRAAAVEPLWDAESVFSPVIWTRLSLAAAFTVLFCLWPGGFLELALRGEALAAFDILGGLLAGGQWLSAADFLGAGLLLHAAWNAAAMLFRGPTMSVVGTPPPAAVPAPLFRVAEGRVDAAALWEFLTQAGREAGVDPILFGRWRHLASDGREGVDVLLAPGGGEPPAVRRALFVAGLKARMAGRADARLVEWAEGLALWGEDWAFPVALRVRAVDQKPMEILRDRLDETGLRNPWERVVETAYYLENPAVWRFLRRAYISQADPRELRNDGHWNLRAEPLDRLRASLLDWTDAWDVLSERRMAHVLRAPPTVVQDEPLPSVTFMSHVDNAARDAATRIKRLLAGWGVKPGAVVESIGAGAPQLMRGQLQWEQIALALGASLTVREPARDRAKLWREFFGDWGIDVRQSRVDARHPLPPGRADVVFLFSVVSDPSIPAGQRREIFNEAVRTLKPGGRLVVGWFKSLSGDEARAREFLAGARASGLTESPPEAGLEPHPLGHGWRVYAKVPRPYVGTFGVFLRRGTSLAHLRTNVVQDHLGQETLVASEHGGEQGTPCSFSWEVAEGFALRDARGGGTPVVIEADYALLAAAGRQLPPVSVEDDERWYQVSGGFPLETIAAIHVFENGRWRTVTGIADIRALLGRPSSADWDNLPGPELHDVTDVFRLALAPVFRRLGAAGVPAWLLAAAAAAAAWWFWPSGASDAVLAAAGILGVSAGESGAAPPGSRADPFFNLRTREFKVAAFKDMLRDASEHLGGAWDLRLAMDAWDFALGYPPVLEIAVLPREAAPGAGPAVSADPAVEIFRAAQAIRRAIAAHPAARMTLTDENIETGRFVLNVRSRHTRRETPIPMRLLFAPQGWRAYLTAAAGNAAGLSAAERARLLLRLARYSSDEAAWRRRADREGRAALAGTPPPPDPAAGSEDPAAFLAVAAPETFFRDLLDGQSPAVPDKAAVDSARRALSRGLAEVFQAPPSREPGVVLPPTGPIPMGSQAVSLSVGSKRVLLINLEPSRVYHMTIRREAGRGAVLYAETDASAGDRRLAVFYLDEYRDRWARDSVRLAPKARAADAESLSRALESQDARAVFYARLGAALAIDPAAPGQAEDPSRRAEILAGLAEASLTVAMPRQGLEMMVIPSRALKLKGSIPAGDEVTLRPFWDEEAGVLIEAAVAATGRRHVFSLGRYAAAAANPVFGVEVAVFTDAADRDARLPVLLSLGRLIYSLGRRDPAVLTAEEKREVRRALAAYKPGAVRTTPAGAFSPALLATGRSVDFRDVGPGPVRVDLGWDDILGLVVTFTSAAGGRAIFDFHRHRSALEGTEGHLYIESSKRPATAFREDLRRRKEHALRSLLAAGLSDALDARDGDRREPPVFAKVRSALARAKGRLSVSPQGALFLTLRRGGETVSYNFPLPGAAAGDAYSPRLEWIEGRGPLVAWEAPSGEWHAYGLGAMMTEERGAYRQAVFIGTFPDFKAAREGGAWTQGGLLTFAEAANRRQGGPAPLPRPLRNRLAAEGQAPTHFNGLVRRAKSLLVLLDPIAGHSWVFDDRGAGGAPRRLYVEPAAGGGLAAYVERELPNGRGVIQAFPDIDGVAAALPSRPPRLRLKPVAEDFVDLAAARAALAARGPPALQEHLLVSAERVLRGLFGRDADVRVFKVAGEHGMEPQVVLFLGGPPAPARLSGLARALGRIPRTEISLEPDHVAARTINGKDHGVVRFWVVDRQRRLGVAAVLRGLLRRAEAAWEASVEDHRSRPAASRRLIQLVSLSTRLYIPARSAVLREKLTAAQEAKFTAYDTSRTSDFQESLLQVRRVLADHRYVESSALGDDAARSWGQPVLKSFWTFRAMAPGSILDPFLRSLKGRGAWGAALYAGLTALLVPVAEELLFRAAVWGEPFAGLLAALFGAAGFGAPPALAHGLAALAISVPVYVLLHPAVQRLHRRFNPAAPVERVRDDEYVFSPRVWVRLAAAGVFTLGYLAFPGGLLPAILQGEFSFVWDVLRVLTGAGEWLALLDFLGGGLTAHILWNAAAPFFGQPPMSLVPPPANLSAALSAALRWGAGPHNLAPSAGDAVFGPYPLFVATNHGAWGAAGPVEAGGRRVFFRLPNARRGPHEVRVSRNAAPVRLLYVTNPWTGRTWVFLAENMAAQSGDVHATLFSPSFETLEEALTQAPRLARLTLGLYLSRKGGEAPPPETASARVRLAAAAGAAALTLVNPLTGERVLRLRVKGLAAGPAEIRLANGRLRLEQGGRVVDISAADLRRHWGGGVVLPGDAAAPETKPSPAPAPASTNPRAVTASPRDPAALVPALAPMVLTVRGRWDKMAEESRVIFFFYTVNALLAGLTGSDPARRRAAFLGVEHFLYGRPLQDLANAYPVLVAGETKDWEVSFGLGGSLSARAGDMRPVLVEILSARGRNLPEGFRPRFHVFNRAVSAFLAQTPAPENNRLPLWALLVPALPALWAAAPGLDVPAILHEWGGRLAAASQGLLTAASVLPFVPVPRGGGNPGAPAGAGPPLPPGGGAAFRVDAAGNVLDALRTAPEAAALLTALSPAVGDMPALEVMVNPRVFPPVSAAAAMSHAETLALRHRLGELGDASFLTAETRRTFMELSALPTPAKGHRGWTRIFEDTYNEMRRRDLTARLTAGAIAAHPRAALDITPLFDENRAAERPALEETLRALSVPLAGSLGGRLALVVDRRHVNIGLALGAVARVDPGLTYLVGVGRVNVFVRGPRASAVFPRPDKISFDALQEDLGGRGPLRAYGFSPDAALEGPAALKRLEIQLIPLAKVLSREIHEAIERLRFLSINA